MLIYHDPNSIIREAYQKILMGGKYILESSSTAKALILKKLDEEPDQIPRAYNYILKSIPDNQIATIYQQVFGRPMRGRASRARGQITDELGYNTTGVNFLLKYAQPNIIDYIGGMVGIDPRAKNSPQQNQNQVQSQSQPQQQTQQTSQDTTQSNANDNIDVPNIKFTGDMVVEVAKQIGAKNIGPGNSDFYAKVINKIFSFAKQKGYNYALSHHLSYYKNQKLYHLANRIQKICDYIVKNPDKFNQNASNQNMEGASKVQAYQKSLNNSSNTNMMGVSTNKASTNKAHTNNIQPNQNKNQTSPTKQQQPKQQTRTDYFHQESFPSEEI